MSTTFTLTVEHDSGRVERWTGTVQSLGYDSGEPFSRIEVTSADMRAVRNLVSSRVVPDTEPDIYGMTTNDYIGLDQ